MRSIEARTSVYLFRVYLFFHVLFIIGTQTGVLPTGNCGFSFGLNKDNDLGSLTLFIKQLCSRPEELSGLLNNNLFSELWECFDISSGVFNTFCLAGTKDVFLLQKDVKITTFSDRWRGGNLQVYFWKSK